MKKLNFVLLSFLFIAVSSCSKSDDRIDPSKYFDQDADCAVGASGTCCDVDGRVLVIPNNSYTYTVKGYRSESTQLTNIVWEVTSGSITIESGQNTPEATFKFGPDFTTGTINAGSLVNGAHCESEISISKL